MPAWPSTLPAPLTENYGVDATDTTVRTDMDSGPARVRRRFTAAPDMLTATWRLSEAQMAIFRTFFEDDIDHGAAWFDMPVKDGRTEGGETQEVRFSAPWRASYIGGYGWTISATIEVRNA